jgi:hypothetical protein
LFVFDPALLPDWPVLCWFVLLALFVELLSDSVELLLDSLELLSDSVELLLDSLELLLDSLELLPDSVEFLPDSELRVPLFRLLELRVVPELWVVPEPRLLVPRLAPVLSKLRLLLPWLPPKPRPPLLPLLPLPPLPPWPATRTKPESIA